MRLEKNRTASQRFGQSVAFGIELSFEEKPVKNQVSIEGEDGSLFATQSGDDPGQPVGFARGTVKVVEPRRNGEKQYLPRLLKLLFCKATLCGSAGIKQLQVTAISISSCSMSGKLVFLVRLKAG